MVFLTDLEYFKNYGEKYSELTYIFYNFGPWTIQYHEMLDYMKDQEIKESRKSSDESGWLYSITSNEPRHESELEKDVSNILENLFFVYEESQLRQILKVVYTTEPMASTNRGDEIDFTKVSLNIRGKRLKYKLRRERQLEKINKLQNDIREHDIDLLEAFRPYRNRANELI